MITTPVKILAVIAIAAGIGLQQGWGEDRVLAINIPLRSRTSPVQRLNRQGVEAVRKNHYEKAEELFYKAYLYDPADPFTLNNLGYVAELQGQLDRAHRYYQLASEQGSDAPIDMSSVDALKGKPMRAAYDNLQDLPMRVNRMNLDAMQLVSEDRGFEAIALLQDALKMDPQNPFTLNNLGVADEAVGDYEGALRQYEAVADLHSSERVTVTADRNWRGKPVSEMAAQSADRLRKYVAGLAPPQMEAIRDNIRGVYEENQNRWTAARQYFLQAYRADPESAFSLNNRGYVAEREGDLETAEFYYDKARKAGDAYARVGLATRGAAAGQSLFAVANDSNDKVDQALEVYRQERRQENAPVELTPRGAGQMQPGGSSQAPYPQQPNQPAGAPSSAAPQTRP